MCMTVPIYFLNKIRFWPTIFFNLLTTIEENLLLATVAFIAISNKKKEETKDYALLKWKGTMLDF